MTLMPIFFLTRLGAVEGLVTPAAAKHLGTREMAIRASILSPTTMILMAFMPIFFLARLRAVQLVIATAAATHCRPVCWRNNVAVHALIHDVLTQKIHECVTESHEHLTPVRFIQERIVALTKDDWPNE
jgi:hypothetical protein